MENVICTPAYTVSLNTFRRNSAENPVEKPVEIPFLSICEEKAMAELLVTLPGAVFPHWSSLSALVLSGWHSCGRWRRWDSLVGRGEPMAIQQRRTQRGRIQSKNRFLSPAAHPEVECAMRSRDDDESWMEFKWLLIRAVSLADWCDWLSDWLSAW